MKLVDDIFNPSGTIPDLGIQVFLNLLAHADEDVRLWCCKRTALHTQEILAKDESTLPASKVFNIFSKLVIYKETAVIEQLAEFNLNDDNEKIVNFTVDILCRLMSVPFLFPSYKHDDFVLEMR